MASDESASYWYVKALLIVIIIITNYKLMSLHILGSVQSDEIFTNISTLVKSE